MKLVSMKKEGGHGPDFHCCASAPSGCGEPDYPYGLRIYLDEETIEALGMKALPVSGSAVGIEGTAMVVGISEEMVDGKTKRRLELQITDMAVASAGPGIAARMYPETDNED